LRRKFYKTTKICPLCPVHIADTDETVESAGILKNLNNKTVKIAKIHTYRLRLAHKIYPLRIMMSSSDIYPNDYRTGNCRRLWPTQLTPPTRQTAVSSRRRQLCELGITR